MVRKGKNSIKIWLKESDEDKITKRSAGQDKEADTGPAERLDPNRELEEWEVFEELKDDVREKMWEIEHAGESEAERLKDLEELSGYGSDEPERE